MDENRFGALARPVTDRFEPIVALRIGLAALATPAAIGLLFVPSAFRPGREPLVFAGIGLLVVLLVHDLTVRRGVVRRLTWTSYLVQIAIMLFGIAAGQLSIVVATLLASVVTPVVMATVVGVRALALMSVAVSFACALVVWAQGDDLVVLLATLPAVSALLVSPAVVVYVYRLNLERAVRTAWELARTDALTGLLNRRGMAEQAGEILGRARQQRLSVGVLVADVDHFKRVNDQHGHVAGDEVLQLVAATTLGCVRPHDLVVRLGGEEIAVIAVIVPRSITALAERIRMEVEAAAQEWGVTVSVGVAWSEPGEQDDAELVHSLLDRADELMYEAKRAGRNRVRVPA